MVFKCLKINQYVCSGALKTKVKLKFRESKIKVSRKSKESQVKLMFNEEEIMYMKSYCLLVQ